MSVIGKKLNPIQSSGGGNNAVSHNNDDDSSGNKQSTQSITPDDVLSLTKIAEEYMCSPGTRHSSTTTCYISMVASKYLHKCIGYFCVSRVIVFNISVRADDFIY